MPRWLFWIIVAIVVLWIISAPAAAGTDIRGWFDSIAAFGTAVTR